MTRITQAFFINSVQIQSWS